MALAQSQLNATQIRAVLASKGLQGELLKTTTDEIANAASTHAMTASHITATTVITNLKNALKGFGVELKALAVAHPILTAIAIIGTTFAGISKIIDLCTTSLEEQKETFENAQNEYDEACNTLDELKQKLETTTSSIDELQKKANNGTITLVEDAELEKLKQTNEELKLQIQNQEIVKKEKANQASNEAYNTYTRENRIDNDNSKSKQIYEASSSFKVGDGFHVNSFVANAKELSDYTYAIEENKKKIDELKKSNDDLNNKMSDGLDEDLTEQYNNEKEYNNKLIAQLTKGNEELKTNAEKNAKDIFSSKIEEFDNYKKTLTNSMNSDGTFDDSNLQNMWNDIQKKTKDLYEYSGRSAEWNTIKFDAVLDDKDLKKSLSEIADKFNAGTLTADDVQGFDDLNSKLNDTELILKDDENAVDVFIKYLNKLKETGTDVGDKLKSSFTKDPTDLLRDSDDKDRKDTSINLADLKNRADVMKTIQKEIEEAGDVGVDTLQTLSKQFPEASEALYDYMTGVKNGAEFFSELEDKYDEDKNKYVENMVEKNQANEDFFNSLKANYPEVFAQMQEFMNQGNELLQENVNNYINSIVTEEDKTNEFLAWLEQEYPELYAQLADVYDNDKESFIRHILSENEENEEFIEHLSAIYPELANALSTVYGNDVNNWTSMEQAKAQITANLIKQLNEMWSQYFAGISVWF